MKKINIIGLGEIGLKTLRQMYIMSENNHRFYGTDIDKSKKSLVDDLDVKFSTKPFKGCDVYIICVWTTDQIIDVIKQIVNINGNRKSLISIESTIDPSRIDEIMEMVQIRDSITLAAFPHRYNPNDYEHGIFNHDRVLGTYPISDVDKVAVFYGEFTAPIHKTTFELAALSKVVENAYRYMEIVLAQELSDALGKERFEVVRKLVNTKWNIDIREAQKGVMGKCLPKDMNLLYNSMSEPFNIFFDMMRLNQEYIERNSK